MVDRSLLREGWLAFRRTVVLLLVLTMLGGSTFTLFASADRVRHYTKPFAFDFLGWTLAAGFDKTAQAALGTSRLLEESRRSDLVIEYLDLVREVHSTQAELEAAYGNPDPLQSSKDVARISDQLAQLTTSAERLQPIAEAILQEQVSRVLSESGLGLGDMVFPPVAFRFARLPSSLIVSPRDVIRQDANISLRVDLELNEKIALEEVVETSEGVSALIVPVGGLGTYPTMILENTSLAWISEVIAHEWVHNYLAFRPLGWNYSTTPELRTMNETTASLIGQSVGHRLLELYYPALIPDPAPVTSDGQGNNDPPAFDFRAEMRITRVRVDELLEQGGVEKAEHYMEQRRLFFWENGYRIRKINQAYFAFHGAYADAPGGAAGDDPVGEAVRTLWERMDSPANFLRRMAWMNSYEDLLTEAGLPIRE